MDPQGDEGLRVQRPCGVPGFRNHAGKGHGAISGRLEKELVRSKFPGNDLWSWAERDDTGYI
jgi:hypothetical protein